MCVCVCVRACVRACVRVCVCKKVLELCVLCVSFSCSFWFLRGCAIESIQVEEAQLRQVLMYVAPFMSFMSFGIGFLHSTFLSL